DSADLPARDSADLPARDSADLPARDSADLPARDSADLPARDSADLPARDSADLPAGPLAVSRETSASGEGQWAQQARTVATKASTSSSVVSKAVIQRTTFSASSQM